MPKHTLLSKIKATAANATTRATWFSKLSPKQQAELLDVRRAFKANELAHGITQICTIIKTEWHLQICFSTLRSWMRDE